MVLESPGLVPSPSDGPESPPPGTPGPRPDRITTPGPDTPDPPDRLARADRLGVALIRLVKLMDRASTHRATPGGGIDRAAYRLLAALVIRGPLRAKALAELVHSDPSTVSRQIAALVRVGYVERRADQADGRAAVLAATPLGQETFETHRRRRNAAIAELTDGWPAEDLTILAELLDRFTTDLETSSGFPGRAPTLPETQERPPA